MLSSAIASSKRVSPLHACLPLLAYKRSQHLAQYIISQWADITDPVSADLVTQNFSSTVGIYFA